MFFFNYFIVSNNFQLSKKKPQKRSFISVSANLQKNEKFFSKKCRFIFSNACGGRACRYPRRRGETEEGPHFAGFAIFSISFIFNGIVR